MDSLTSFITSVTVFHTSVTVTDSFMVYGALGGSTLHARYLCDLFVSDTDYKNNLMGSLGRWGGGERKATISQF